MNPGYETAEERQAPRFEGGRRAEVEYLDAFRRASRSTGVSLLQFAHDSGVPESTVRHWVSRAASSGAPPEFVELIESPVGLEVLHRVILAAQFVLTQVVGGGVRTVCTFLELSGLWRVVAAGYGTQQEAVKAMEEAIVVFGTEEHQRLAAQMKPKSITVTQDETFHHGRPCLVASEPVSNYILVEEHAEERRAETWDAAMTRGLKGLPVTVIQSTSDEGSALRKHSQESLGAHHSPDLFHPQQDISRATSLPLQRQSEAADQMVGQAGLAIAAVLDEADAYDAIRSGPGRPRDYDKRIERANEAFCEAQAAAKVAKERRERVREQARGISQSYHPFDLQTGAKRDAAMVEADLQARFDAISQVANDVRLSDRCRALLDKARRLVPQMVATIAFVHTLIQHKLEVLDLAPAVQDAVGNRLIPACYLEEVVRKAPTADARQALRSTIARLHTALDLPDSPLAALDAEERDTLDRVARECAQLFQRSSSNVEGRNGVLALRQHSLHLLSPRKLRALTVVHNFYTTRPDGTTAAGRFFGQRHRDLFEHLLMVIPPPRRPAERRATVH
jgi:hypothetical protein